MSSANPTQVVRLSLAVVAFSLFAVGCAQPQSPRVIRTSGDAKLFTGMGNHRRTVTTSDPLAQQFFDQGLAWTYAFNHDEAIRCYSEAARLDPNCGMAWWGVALCKGPHINNPMMPPERSAAAWKALQQAVAVKQCLTPVERDLITALEARYAKDAPEDRSSLDRGYANAMANVWRMYPDDNDVGTLYAEALMDLHPWDLWTHAGEPKDGTEAILALLERVLELNPSNPGANHLYIHAVEAARPKLALDSAKRLCDMLPGSGHMLHMPSHIYVLTGKWDEAAVQNRKAIASDAAYRRIVPRQGFYQIYMLHNDHMLSFASMMTGRYEEALSAAANAMPKDRSAENAMLVDPWMGVRYDVFKRFGKWDEMLAEPKPAAHFPITTAMYHFNRGIAFAAKGDIDGARREKSAMHRQRDLIAAERIMGINKVHDLLDIADEFLDGEIAFRQGHVDQSVRHLQRAIALEDKLIYMEPPEWSQPVRHTLGAVLLSAGRHEEAAKAYQEDLENWPDNGWSLYGMQRCMEMAGDSDAAKTYANRFEKIWASADTPIGSSCQCIPKT